MRFAEWHELSGLWLEEVKAGNRCILIDGVHQLSFALQNDELTADLEDIDAPSEVIVRAAKVMCIFGYRPR